MVDIGSGVPNPSIQSQVGGNPQAAAEIGAGSFPSTAINLQTANALSRKFPVLGLNKASARVTTSSFGSAIVEVKGSIDGTNFQSLPLTTTLLSATPGQADFSIVGFSWIMFEVTTNDGAADASAQCWLYPYRLDLT